MHDKRTPGLFKMEWEGDGIIALCSKTHICFGSQKDKVTGKGLSKRQNDFRHQHFALVLDTQVPGHGVNRSFRLKHGQMYTYSQEKVGLPYLYGKCRVIEDGVSTLPMPL